MSVKSRIIKLIENGNNVSSALDELNKYAKNHPRRAEDLARALLTKTDLVKNQVRDLLENDHQNRYHYLSYSQSAFVIAVNATPSAKRFVKPVLAVVLLLAVAMVGVVYYDENVKDIPMESVGLEFPSGDLSASQDYDLIPVFTPADCRDKTLVWTVDKPGITLTETENGMRMHIDYSVSDGTLVSLTLYNEKYQVRAVYDFKVSNDLSVSLSAEKDSVKAGDTVMVKCSGNTPGFNPELDWSTDVSWVKIRGNGPSVTVNVDYGAAKGDSFSITAKVRGTDMSATMKFTVSEAFVLKVGDMPSSPSAGDRIPLSFTASKDVSAMKVQWSQDCTTAGIVNENGTTYLDIGMQTPKGTKITVHVSIPEIGMSAEKTIRVAGGLDFSFDKSFSSLKAGDGFTISLKASIPNFKEKVVWSVNRDWVTLKTNGTSVTGSVAVGAERGDSFELKAQVPSLGLEYRETFRVAHGVEVSIEEVSGVSAGTVWPGTTAVLKATSPVVPSGVSVEWTVSGEGFKYTVSDGMLHLDVDRMAVDGSKITVTAGYKSMGEKDTIVFTVDNPEMRPIEVGDADAFRSIEAKPSLYYTLTSDIDLGGVPWIPFKFSGILDGNGHTVNGFVLSNMHSEGTFSKVGMFSENEGIIKNLKVADAFLAFAQKLSVAKTITEEVGIICGTNNGTIEGCTVSGKVFAHSLDYQFQWNKYKGNEFGPSNQNLLDVPGYRAPEWIDWIRMDFCASKPSYQTTHETHISVGGIAGTNCKTIKDSVSDVDIDAMLFNLNAYESHYASDCHNGYICVGGISGDNTGTVSGSRSSGMVEGGVYIVNSGSESGWVENVNMPVDGYIGKVNGKGSSSGCDSTVTLVKTSKFVLPEWNWGSADFNKNKQENKSLDWTVTSP